eukprot:Sspe_Gene.5081::Locus_1671_Transcript_1_1_Confidence_1.000_Length_375::g.5081::m.5081
MADGQQDPSAAADDVEASCDELMEEVVACALAEEPPRETGRVSPAHSTASEESVASMAQVASAMMGPTKRCPQCEKQISESMFDDHVKIWCENVVSGWD